MQVMSVTGPVNPDELGRTLVHEHVVISLPGEELDPGHAPDKREIAAIAVDRLQELRDHGVASMVDPCPIEMGRDPELYAEVSERSGVKIIFATGFYMESMGIPPYWRARDADEVADFYLHEIAEGVGKTGLRPGVIKAATGVEVTAQERKMLAGAAMAQRQARVAIITHTEHSLHGEVQQDIFAENGADLSRVLIGHQDEQMTPEPILKLAERGTFVGVDRVGTDILNSDEVRADNVMALVKRGFTRQVCLSQDCVCTMTASRFPFPVPKDRRPTPQAFMQRNKPLSYVVTTFAEKLRERGVTDADLDTIFRDNPRRLLTGEA
jgi:phosphotriesterase-related protein